MAMIQIKFSHPGLLTPPLPFQLLGTVEYRGVSSSTYRTEFDALRAGRSWKQQGRRMT